MGEHDSDDGLPDESEEDDIHPLGFRKGDEIVVCMGDDQPDSFVGWLEKLVERYCELYAEAEEQGHDPSSQGIPCGVGEFVSAIGIDLRDKPWTGSLISGTWYHGWMKVGAECEVQAKAQGIFAELQALADGGSP
jgi:hypothetical protein